MILRSIWLTDETLTGTNSLDQSGPWSNENEGVLLIPKISKIGASRLDVLAGNFFSGKGMVLPLYRVWSRRILSHTDWSIEI